MENTNIVPVFHGQKSQETIRQYAEIKGAELGLKVCFNEKDWSKRRLTTKQIDDILSKQLIEHKQIKEKLLSGDSIFSQCNDFDYSIPARQTLTESNPTTGSYETSKYMESDGRYYDVYVRVNWQYGYGLYSSYVTFSASVTEDYFWGTHCEVMNPAYFFHGRSFSGGCSIYYYRYNTQVNPTEIFLVTTIYDKQSGVGTIEIS